jgi:hypothetical protein
MPFHRWALGIAVLLCASSVHAEAVLVTDAVFAGSIAINPGTNIELSNGILLYDNSIFGPSFIPVSLTPTANGYTYNSGIIQVPVFGKSITELVAEYAPTGSSTPSGLILSIDPTNLMANGGGLIAQSGQLGQAPPALAPGIPFDTLVNPSEAVTPTITEQSIIDEINQLADGGVLIGAPPAGAPPPPPDTLSSNTTPNLFAYASQDTGGFANAGVGSSFDDSVWAFSGGQNIGSINGNEDPPQASEPATLTLLSTGLLAFGGVFPFQRRRKKSAARATALAG